MWGEREKKREAKKILLETYAHIRRITPIPILRFHKGRVAHEDNGRDSVRHGRGVRRRGGNKAGRGPSAEEVGCDLCALGVAQEDDLAVWAAGLVAGDHFGEVA